MIGRLLGHYEITAQLGKGGMGEVFRARDTKLDREVAVKVLPTEMSGDPERKARFEREARSLASLQHPNVASIYGFEDIDGLRFLVMELVEGEDLSQRLERGAIAPAEARSIAMQIAAGLEAAHDTGLVHRDLKPANIMVSAVGDVKVLDFGLARAWYGDPEAQGDASMSPTITAAMTQAGTILGTAAYMSPEQARGRGVDRRADIWAFGVILYEMLSGQRLFEGDTISDTMAAVLRAEVDWSVLPTDAAPELCHLAERCLQRDPRQRLRDIGEARIMLEPGGAPLSSMGMRAMPEAAGRRRVQPVVAALVGLACLSIGATLGVNFLAPSAEKQVIQATLLPPAGTTFNLNATSPGISALSPDGRMIAFTATDEAGTPNLWLRRLDQVDAVIISGSATAAYPFWSPDSEFVGFFEQRDGRLRKVPVRGGPPVTLCPASNGKGGTWNRDGVIVFAAEAVGGLRRVTEHGGQPDSLTVLGTGVDSHRHPRFLPDQKHFVFLARGSSPEPEHAIMLGSLDSKELSEITRSRSNAEYADGKLFTVRENILMASELPPPYTVLKPGGIPVVENIAVLATGAAAAAYSVLDGGMLVYHTGTSNSETALTLLDPASGQTTQIGETGQLAFPRISPDGTRAIVQITGDQESGIDLWLVDLDSGLRSRFTFAVGEEQFAIWTRDSRNIVYSRSTPEKSEIILQSVEGTAPAQVLYESPQVIQTSSLSPDEQTVYFDSGEQLERAKIMRITLGEGAEAEEFLGSEEFQGSGMVSPDGKWIAYHATSNQGFDVFVTPSDGSTRKWQITRSGSVWPSWSTDGTRLYHTSYAGNVSVTAVDGSTDTFRAGATTAVATGPSATATGRPYEIEPGGQRLLFAAGTNSESTLSQLHLVTDWRAGLQQR